MIVLPEPLVASMILKLQHEIEGQKGLLWHPFEKDRRDKLLDQLKILKAYYAENCNGSLEDNQQARYRESALKVLNHMEELRKKEEKNG